MDNILTSNLKNVPVDAKQGSNNQFCMKDYAITFLYGMGKTQRDRFKAMLEHGYECGMSVASNYGIDYKEFISEVKKLLEVEE